jgi:hypothetical protein
MLAVLHASTTFRGPSQICEERLPPRKYPLYCLWPAFRHNIAEYSDERSLGNFRRKGSRFREFSAG